MERERKGWNLKKEKRRKVDIGCLLLVMLIFLLRVPVSVVTASESGSIKMELPKEAQEAEMILYQVAVRKNDAFQYSGGFEECGVAIPSMEIAEDLEKAAEQLAAYADEKEISGIKGTADSEGKICYSDLEPGLYLLVQVSGMDAAEIQKAFVPIPYLADEYGTVSYDVVLQSKYAVPDGAVILNKVDDSGKAVEQAQFSLQKKTYVANEGHLPSGVDVDQDGGGRYFWKEVQSGLTTGAGGQIGVSGLTYGVYRFVETKVPDGYVVRRVSEIFEISAPGQIQEVDGILKKMTDTVGEVIAVNDRTSLTVNKVDTSNVPVSGAQLVIKDANGEVIRNEKSEAKYSFTTEKEAYILRKLPAGKYYLSEVAAPDGYLVAEDVPFTVSAQPDASNSVTMVDIPEGYHYDGELTITKKTKKGTKEYKAKDTFYAAVFEDSTYTKRIGDVITLDMNGKSSVSQIVSIAIGDSPDSSRKVYVTETDKSGAPIGTGKEYTVSVDKTSVELSSANPKAQVTITNTFSEESETEKETEPETESIGGKTSNHGGTTSQGGVKTGDDTPIIPYLLALAAAFVLLLLLKRTHRKQ